MTITLTEQEKNLQLIALLKKTIHKEEELRERFKADEKYRYIPNKLRMMLSRLEASTEKPNEEQVILMPPWIKKVEDDEALVHVYLYHSQGDRMQSWQRMLAGGALDEIGVNRPVYEQRFQVEKFLQSTQNSYNHAYASVIVKKSEIIRAGNLEDGLGQPIVRLIQGSILEDKFVDFVTNNTEHFRDHLGRLVCKEDFVPEG